MVNIQGLPGFLESRLSRGNEIRVYHVSTLPTSCPPLFAPGPRRSEEATSLESHFLAISQSRSETVDTNAEEASPVLAFAIEVLIFRARRLTTIFVSKADSTGFLGKSKSSPASRHMSLIQTVITAFLEFLVQSNLNRAPLVLSLFARSQNQYLFPGSSENVTKHILDDRKLIKWWCKVLDPVAHVKNEKVKPSAKAYLVVPGCDTSETKAFFPTPDRPDLQVDSVWFNAYPVTFLVDEPSLPPRCLVPRLPDDPKSRFLDDLDARADDNGGWRGVNDLDQFWEMMSYRQECSAGRLVGFVWIVFEQAIGGERDHESDHSTRWNSEAEMSFPRAAVRSSLDMSTTSGIAEVHAILPSSPLFSQEILTQDRDMSTRSAAHNEMTSHVNMQLLLQTAPSESAVNEDESKSKVHDKQQASHITNRHGISSNGHHPQSSPAELLAEIRLTSEKYQELMDELLQLDFAGEKLAIESTRKWQDKAMSLADVTQFGVQIEGSLAEIVEKSQITAMPQRPINMLTGVRKKRKIDQTESVPNAISAKVSKT